VIGGGWFSLLAIEVPAFVVDDSFIRYCDISQRLRNVAIEYCVANSLDKKLSLTSTTYRLGAALALDPDKRNGAD
jgi:hypothetical protein